MKKINLKNLFKKKDKIINSEPSMAWPINFVRDWKIIVLIFAVGLISLSLFAWRIYLSNKIAGGYLAPTVEFSDISIKTIDQKRLQIDISILETKQADWSKFKINHPKLVDPSL